ncbi:uncharacterized protein PAC_14312 [Phialocephala subalpina]|uniref:Zn(2)-C6 fungal-type domain-containing protein n=1 Tax=Phialocephala subalpina TaxID=576137 RepID=A0A1L7XHB2_9HELO|nr:uncharacterized protein PAC_14312 [Phialocephala subalpina]
MIIAIPKDGRTTRSAGSRSNTKVGRINASSFILDRTVSAVTKPKLKKTKAKARCYTCKYRRVKCDEAGPICQRCIKFGVDCEGYAPTSKASGSTRAILPKTQSKSPQLPFSQTLDRSTIYKLHSGPRFEDHQDGRCFRLYIDQVASQIQGPFKSSLWDQLIPQASEGEPFIRHAIIAIGAIGKIMSEQKLLSLVAAPQTALDYAYALNQFDKAFRGMRTAITNDEVINAFVGLDLHVLFFLDTRPLYAHAFIIEGGNRAVDRVPIAFSSLKVVRSFWPLIMRRNYHFIKLALVKGQSELSCAPWKYDDVNAPWETQQTCFRVDATKPVFKRICESGTQEEKSSFFFNETKYGNFIGHWKRMLSLGTYIHSHMAAVTTTDTPYHFDLGTISPMIFIGMRCRDRAIRDEVFRILFKVHYREGMWDTLAAGKFIEWVKELEGPARDEHGHKPEHARAIVTSSYVDLERDRAILSATINCMVEGWENTHTYMETIETFKQLKY